MKHFPILGSLAVVLGGLLATHAGWASGDSMNLPGNLGPEFLLFSAEGYLGVVLGEVDSDRASALPKDAHGAEVVMVDHDAPVGKSGLRFTTSFFSSTGRRWKAWTSCAAGCTKCRRDAPSAYSSATMAIAST